MKKLIHKNIIFKSFGPQCSFWSKNFEGNFIYFSYLNFGEINFNILYVYKKYKAKCDNNVGYFYFICG